MTKWPIARYIHCVQQLKTPLPKEIIDVFLDGLDGNEVEKTSLDTIFFDLRKGKVSCKPSQSNFLESIDDLATGLGQYHKTSYSKEIKARLYKIYTDRINSMLDLGGDTSREKTSYLFSTLTPAWVINMHINRKDVTSVGTFVNIFIGEYGKHMVELTVTVNTHNVVVSIKVAWQAPEKIKRCLELCHSIDCISQAPDCNYLSNLGLGVAALPLLPDSKESCCIFTFSELLPETRKQWIKRGGRLDSLYDGVNYYRARGTFDVDTDFGRVAKIFKLIEEKKSTKGKFNGLLFTHNTNLEVAINFFRGKYKAFRAIDEDTGRPQGRGAQFRWGLDSQYGEIIFVMKPNFFRKYKRGVTVNGELVNYVYFTDFWNAIGGKEEMLKAQMITEAKKFTFRKYKRAADDVCMKDTERYNYGWCNLQIHLGEDVNLEDVHTVFIPSMHEKRIGDIGIDHPLYGKIEYYAQNIFPYSWIYPNLQRDDNYSIVSDQKFDEKLAVDKGLRRNAVFGNSSRISLSQDAFDDLQQRYMRLLLNQRY